MWEEGATFKKGKISIAFIEKIIFERRGEAEIGVRECLY